MTNKIGKKRKITFWTRLGFGMGGMLNSGALTFTHSYMVLFLSPECGLSAGEAALISSFAIYVNAILCPLMGFVADNFYATKIGRIFGRRRFWILLAIPMMIAEPTRRTPISYAVFCLKKKQTEFPNRCFIWSAYFY